MRGSVENWRFTRENTNLIHCSLIDQQHRIDIRAVLPLPFDDELNEQEAKEMKEGTDAAVAEYWQLVKSGALGDNNKATA